MFGAISIPLNRTKAENQVRAPTHTHIIHSKSLADSVVWAWRLQKICLVISVNVVYFAAFAAHALRIAGQP